MGRPGGEEAVRTQEKNRVLHRYRLELVNGSSRGNSPYVGKEYGEFNSPELRLWPGWYGLVVSPVLGAFTPQVQFMLLRIFRGTFQCLFYWH